MFIDTFSTLGVFIQWDTSIQKCICVCRWACINVCTRMHCVKNTWKACLRACPYACRLFFLSPSAALGKFAGWLCALQSVSRWIMGAGGSASGSGNSKCVKRRDCPGRTRKIGWGSLRVARQTPRSSCRLQGQEFLLTPSLQGCELQIATQEYQQLFPGNSKLKSASADV